MRKTRDQIIKKINGKNSKSLNKKTLKQIEKGFINHFNQIVKDDSLTASKKERMIKTLIKYTKRS
jgi:hypothetical protein